MQHEKFNIKTQTTQLTEEENIIQLKDESLQGILTIFFRTTRKPILYKNAKL